MSPTSMFSRNNLILLLLGGDGIAAEPGEPVAGERDPLRPERVEPRTPLAAMLDQPGGLELLEMPSRRRPGMAEQPGDLAGGQCSAGEVQADQDPAPRRVGEGVEDRSIG